MKKLIAVLIVLVLITGMAFAQIADGLKLGAWGRTAVVPLEMTLYKGGPAEGHDKDQDLAAELGQSWGGAFGRVRMDFSGANEFIGFNMQIQSDGGTPGFGDNAGMWVQPMKMLRLDLGLFKYDFLRGKIAADTDYHLFTLNHSSGDSIFTRFAGGTAGVDGGALLSITPIDGLYIGAMVPHFPGISGPMTGNATMAKDVYDDVQIAAGYTIANIGLFRVQYVGSADETTSATIAGNPVDLGPNKRIEAAFAYTGIENMTIDLGTKIYMPFTQRVDSDNTNNKVALNQAHQVNAGVNMTMGDIGIMAKVDTSFGAQFGQEKYTHPFGFNVHLLPTYNLGFATVGLEMGIMGATKAKLDTTEYDTDYVDFGVGAWIMKDLGKGYIKAGVTFTLDEDPGTGHPDHAQDAYFRIPIVAQFAF